LRWQPCAGVTRPGRPGGPSPDPDEGAWYNYLADTDFVEATEVRNAATEPLLRTTRTYETGRDLIDAITNSWLGDETPPGSTDDPRFPLWPR
jgi:hypothetical protein